MATRWVGGGGGGGYNGGDPTKIETNIHNISTFFKFNVDIFRFKLRVSQAR